MAESVGITLGGIALLDPAIKACRKACGVYKLTRNFGEHYVGVQRRLDGEQARLEIALETQLAVIPDKRVSASI